MKIFHRICTVPIVSGLFLISCQNHPQKELQKPQGKIIANPIVYEIIIKNPEPDNEWLTHCLKNTNRSFLIKKILTAVKNGHLKAYDYYDNHQLSQAEISTIIIENKLEKTTGKIQFVEDWYWDKDQLRLYKKVKKLMFGFEIYDSTGKLRGYKASFVVNLGKSD